MFARLAALVLALSVAQDGGLLRIRVVLNDAAGTATPIPRVTLLVSDNPASGEPRRVRTSNDGTVELKLRPGSYTVESDQPIAFGGNAYTWTQMINVVPGREAVLDLNAKNAEIEAVTAAAVTPGAAKPIDADSATVLAKYQDSVVEIWTPVAHASGFVIDAQRGLIATSQRAIGTASDVEIEMSVSGKRNKVAGRVIHEDRLTGAAILRVDPKVLGSIPPVSTGCPAPKTLDPHFRDEITAIVAPMLGGKELADGEVNRVTPQAIFVEMRLVRDAAGGPVFSPEGDLLGISAIADADSRTSDVFVVPVASLCETITAAEKKITGDPPKATPLPLDPPRAAASGVMTATSGKKAAPTTAISASNFDIRLMTPDQLREYGNSNPMADVANWNNYIRDIAPVLLIRVSPQFEESLWKMIARGAASTQGMNLPPLKSFTSNFLKMRVYCGDAEVTPIHPFIIERPIPDHAPIREGLYVFDRTALGTQCKSVRLDLFSEKSPNTPESRTIDPKLFSIVTMN
jgi:S1-C subfamily serine protease